MNEKEEEKLIENALKHINFEMYVDAISLFKNFTEEYKESKYIDDVYYDIGLCYFKLKNFNKSINCFEFVIEKYPDSDIDSFSKREFGKTAAKCHLGIINCYLILNQKDKIQYHFDSLKKYDESSYVLDNLENKLTFYEIAKKNIDLSNEC